MFRFQFPYHTESRHDGNDVESSEAGVLFMGSLHHQKFGFCMEFRSGSFGIQATKPAFLKIDVLKSFAHYRFQRYHIKSNR